MSCDVGEAMEGLANEALLILQPFRCRFAYITWQAAHATVSAQLHNFTFCNMYLRLCGTSGESLSSHRWGPEFASRSLHLGFMMDKTESGNVFLRVSPIFPYHKFYSTISPTHLIHFVHFINPCDDAIGLVGQHPCIHRPSI